MVRVYMYSNAFYYMLPHCQVPQSACHGTTVPDTTMIVITLHVFEGIWDLFYSGRSREIERNIIIPEETYNNGLVP